METLPLFVAPMVTLLLTELISKNRPTIDGFFCFKSELEKLNKTIQTIETVLPTVKKHPPEFNDSLRMSMKRLQDLLYEMDDLFDAITVDQGESHVDGNGWIIRTRVCFCRFFSRSNPLIVSARYCGKLKRIKDTLDAVITDMDRSKSIIESTMGNNGGTENPDESMPETSSLIDPKNFIGRESEKEKIMKFLLSEKEDEFSFSVFGMGGLGKTDLARLIFNEEGVEKKFEQRLWVWVSRESSKLKPTIKKVLDQIPGPGQAKLSVDTPLQNLQEIFEVQMKKKTLVVLDDLWKMSANDWEELCKLLNMTRKNKVLITTRFHQVVSPLNDQLRLKPLTLEESWSLFKKHAKICEDGDPSTKTIVERCHGLPSLVKTFALLFNTIKLKGMRGLELNDLEKKEIWKLGHSIAGAEVKDILQRLKPSYDDLESCIKSCLVYCAVCAHPLDVQRVAQMWIAQRFIKTSIGGDELEDTANGYFDQLESASFIEDVEEDDLLQVTKFQLPPLVRDLALFLSADEYSDISNSNVEWESSHAPRHVSLSGDVGDFPTQVTPSNQKLLRTFAWRRNAEMSESSLAWFSNFKSLRVMDLKSMQFNDLPVSIKSLRHLRYVDISQNKLITSLPSSIGNLCNLETLRVDNCDELGTLPQEICRLRKLRNLYMSCKQQSLEFISGITSLRTLQLVNCTCLKSLPDMKLFTRLRNLGILKCSELEFAGEKDMKGLKVLQSLTLVGLPKLLDLPSGLDDAKNSLRSLYFEDCSELKTSPEWFKSLKSLQRLTIKGCTNIESLTDGDLLPRDLKLLWIEHCPKLIEKGVHWNLIKHVHEFWLDGNIYPSDSNTRSSNSLASSSAITSYEHGESSNGTRGCQDDKHEADSGIRGESSNANGADQAGNQEEDETRGVPSQKQKRQSINRFEIVAKTFSLKGINLHGKVPLRLRVSNGKKNHSNVTC